MCMISHIFVQTNCTSSSLVGMPLLALKLCMRVKTSFSHNSKRGNSQICLGIPSSSSSWALRKNGVRFLRFVPDMTRSILIFSRFLSVTVTSKKRTETTKNEIPTAFRGREYRSIGAWSCLPAKDNKCCPKGFLTTSEKAPSKICFC